MFVRINDAAKVYCTQDWEWDTGKKSSGDFDLWTILDGKGKLEHVNGNTYNFSRGDCFLLRYYERYISKQSLDNPLTVIYVHYDYIDNEGNIVIPSEMELPPLHRKLKNFVFTEELLEKIVSYFKNSSKEPMQASSWLQCVLMEIKENDSRSNLTIIEVEQLDMVENTCEMILRYPAKEYKVYDIAKGFSYSPDHFSRIFKKFKKVTIQEFIIRTRIDYAKALLCNSRYTVTKIAELTGYKDIFHFSKQFAGKTGVSPSAYRKIE